MSEQADNRTQFKGPITRRIPEGDDRERLVCDDCGFVAYENPKIIAGVVCTWEERYLFCRRAIEPRKGYWTIPAGFLEMGETTGQGAAREAYEEALANVDVTGLLGIYEIPRISQMYVIHSGTLKNPDHAPGVESLETALLEWADIPWDELAFPSVGWALEKHRRGGAPEMVQAS